MNLTKRTAASALIALLIFFAFAANLSVSATETPTRVTIEFKGDEAERAGYAQSVVTVIPGDGCALTGHYLVYYTDGNGVLAGYDEILSIPVDDGYTVSGEVGDGRMIPEGAKGIAVFESDTKFVDDPPSITQAVATAEIPLGKRTPDLGTPELSFGAISDSHMNYEAYDRGAYAKLRSTMDFFASQGMEMVVISGDVTGDRGEDPDLEVQYEAHIRIINESDFDFDKVYEAIGNHGNTPADAPLLNQYLGGSDEVHPFTDSPYFHVYRAGSNGKRNNLFIFMAQELQKPGESAAYDNFSKAQIDWLEGLLDTYDNANTNIFILEHSPFLGYGAGDIEGGSYTTMVTFRDDYPQNMRLKGLLETHKDAVVLSGHTHVTFYDDANYSDVYNSFARTVHVGSNCQPCGYNGGYSLIRSTDGRHDVTTEYGSEGYTVRVYKDQIVFTGYNFTTGKKIPAACLIMPVKAYGGPGKPETPVYTPDEAFSGSGTADDPYIIATAEDFKKLTDGFNASTSTAQTQMYGYGKFFRQTADIDMTLTEGYQGTSANGSGKCFFAGVYDGGGHTLKVNINAKIQRSVFPYVYGTVANLKIEGRIASEASAQPVRTLYGSVVNCIFDLDLKADITNGVCYSNYNLVTNVYTSGTNTGTNRYAVSTNSTSTNYVNVFHYRTTAEGAAVTDARGTRSNDTAAIAAAFDSLGGNALQSALAATGGTELSLTRTGATLNLDYDG
ncbi:MAG: metallophosphoesterase, partial [Clostridia bacterium]|nr:metallophosphoesterase [Clostridia bacterium]